jgi:hypothetical protein
LCLSVGIRQNANEARKGGWIEEEKPREQWIQVEEALARYGVYSRNELLHFFTRWACLCWKPTRQTAELRCPFASRPHHPSWPNIINNCTQAYAHAKTHTCMSHKASFCTCTNTRVRKRSFKLGRVQRIDMQWEKKNWHEKAA